MITNYFVPYVQGINKISMTSNTMPRAGDVYQYCASDSCPIGHVTLRDTIYYVVAHVTDTNHIYVVDSNTRIIVGVCDHYGDTLDFQYLSRPDVDNIMQQIGLAAQVAQ